MRVSVIINSKAGSVNADLVQAKIQQALFRCDLRIARPGSLPEMEEFIHNEVENRTDNLIVCGGDGTVNAVIQSLMKFSDLSLIPPLTIIRSGTANDLAHAMGVSHRIERAARSIFEGDVKYIDVIEVSSEEQTAYMITNGGLGLPAKAADLANKFRSHLRQLSTCPKSAKAYRFLAEKSYFAVKRMGHHVYSVMAAEAIRTWNPEGWGLEIDIPGMKTIETDSPMVFVNNQKSIGANFLPAPYTSNGDGTVNLLLAETKSLPEYAMATYHIRRGTVLKNPNFRSFELKEFKLKSKDGGRPLTFFGDGEILLRDVPEIQIRCLHRGLPVVVS